MSPSQVGWQDCVARARAAMPSRQYQNKRRPVGGEDRAPACQKRLGKSGPAGETGPVCKKAPRPSPLLLTEMGEARVIGKMQEMHVYSAQDACTNRELFQIQV